MARFDPSLGFVRSTWFHLKTLFGFQVPGLSDRLAEELMHMVSDGTDWYAHLLVPKLHKMVLPSQRGWSSYPPLRLGSAAPLKPAECLWFGGCTRRGREVCVSTEILTYSTTPPLHGGLKASKVL
jgi:hypothetical protein